MGIKKESKDAQLRLEKFLTEYSLQNKNKSNLKVLPKINTFYKMNRF